MSKFLKISNFIPTFDPNSYKILCFDFFFMIINIIILIQIPLDYCFNFNFSNNISALYYIYVEILPLLFILTNIILKLNSGYFSHCIYISDKKKIFHNYIKGEFIIDFISIIPYFNKLFFNDDNLKISIFIKNNNF